MIFGVVLECFVVTSDVLFVFLCFRFQFSAGGRVGIFVVMLFVFLVRNDEKRRKRIGEEGREGKGREWK